MKRINQYAAYAICKILDIEPKTVSADDFYIVLKYQTLTQNELSYIEKEPRTESFTL